MDGQRFDRLARVFASWASRRQILKGLAVGAAGGLLGAERANAQQENEALSTIAAVSEQALSELDSVADLKGHPDPNVGLFYEHLVEVAREGTQAKNWTRSQAQVGAYALRLDGIALGVAAGAAVYIELEKEGYCSIGDRPPTCMYESIARWRECLSGCGGDIGCEVQCFWDFMLFSSCLRCLQKYM
jgi:hypothetical protein